MVDPAVVVATMHEGDAAAHALGIEVVEAGAGRAVTRFTVDGPKANLHGVCHGGLIFTLADTAMVLAAVSHAGTFKPFATTDLHTQFLRPGGSSAILCDAQVVRAGKALVFARADMRQAETDKLIATATGTFYAP